MQAALRQSYLIEPLRTTKYSTMNQTELQAKISHPLKARENQNKLTRFVDARRTQNCAEFWYASDWSTTQTSQL